MTVYVLVYFDDDGDNVIGVYSTYDLAFNYAKDRYPKYYFPKYYFTIKSFIIDIDLERIDYVND